jgi:tetratricopeptide (TPR) repeat protein
VVVQRYEAERMPFALVLRDFSFRHLIVKSEDEFGFLLENHLYDQFEPLGIGVIQTQQQRDGLPAVEAYSRDLNFLTVRAPSLCLRNENWLEAVTYLIQRAELMVVTLAGGIRGLGLELEAIAAAGRADRTVVILNELAAYEGGHITHLPVLRHFARVLSLADLDPETPVDSFVFEDLVRRLVSIRRMGAAQRRELIDGGNLDRAFPVSWGDFGERYEALAVSCRGEGRRAMAAGYFGSAARIAMIGGNADAAARRTLAQVDVLSGAEQEGRSVLARLADELGKIGRERGDHDPAIGYARARLVAEQARMMHSPGELATAIGILEKEHARWRARSNRRACAALLTALAWKLREKRDPAGVLDAGEEAFRLAREEDDKREAARALIVLGVTWHELGDLPAAGKTLGMAADIVPRDEESHEDVWLICMRLGDVFRDAGRIDEARSVLNAAVSVAEHGSFPLEANEARKRLAALTLRSTE